MRLLFIALVLLIVNPIKAQDDIHITTQQSAIFKDKKKHTELLFTEADGQGGFVTVRLYYGGMMMTPKGYYIDHYNKDLEPINSYDLELEKTQLHGIKVDDGIVSLLQTELDNKADKFRFNVLQSSLTNFDFKKRNLISFSEDDVRTYFGIGIGPFYTAPSAQNDFGSLGMTVFSADKNFLCVNWDIKNKDQQTQRMYVFDKDFELVYKKEFKRDIKDRLFDFKSMDLDDDDGTIYLLGKVFNKNRRSKKEGKANYHYELFKINEEGEKRLSFDTGENFASSLSLFKNEGELICAGFYSERKDYRYKGVVYFSVDDATLAIKSEKFTPFTDSFLEEKYGKAKDKELRDLRYRSVFLDADSNLTINAEEYYSRTSTMNTVNGGSNTITTFYFKDIVSVKMDPNGELIWARNINKRQSTSGRELEYYSYSSTTLNNNIYIFINCSDKIKKLSKDRIEFKGASSKKANLYVLRIDPDGNMDYKSIVDDKDSEVAFFVRQGTLTNNTGDEMVFFGRRKSKKQFLKVNIGN